MISNVTFSGGVHIDDKKEFSQDEPLENASIPSLVHIPLLQGVGSVCDSLVSVGDQVKVGQKIGGLEGNFGACVHSSVSGEVTEISERYTSEGKKVSCISIQIDGQDDHIEFLSNYKDDGFSPEELVELAKEAGITGMGGAGFPFGVKLSGALGGKVDSILANGAECEPYLTSDHRLMLEFPEEIIEGVDLAMKATGAENGYIAIEDNKPNAIDSINKALDSYSNISLASLKTKYPQGDSARVIDAVLDRQVKIGERSGSVKVFVSNVGTFKAFRDAVYDGIPLYQRIVSVTGAGVKKPKNLMVRIGTPIRSLIEDCGGFNGEFGAIIAGGPMSGNQQFDLDAPITKSITGIVVLTRDDLDLRPERPCIKCGRCVEVCPIHLNPALLNAAINKEKFEMAKELYVEECIQCGACSYVCPAKRHLAESMKLAMNEIWAKSI